MQENSEIKLSIVMPVWNQEILVTRALESIPKRKDIEIIINNDSSEDNTEDSILNFIEKYEDYYANIIYLKNRINRGVGYTINKCYDMASGQYIVALGSDDFFYPDNLEKAMSYLDGETDMIYFNLRSNDGHEWIVNEESKKGLVGSVKFIKREFLGNTRCPDARAGEDWDFTNKLYAKNPSEKYTNLVVKHYNYPRIGSLSNPNMKRQYGVSIIVSLYKESSSFIQLLESLIYQKRKFYPETEIILINDNILKEEYLRENFSKDIIFYSNFDNKGYNYCKNIGMMLSSKQYITFIDAQDFITDNYLHEIYSSIKTNKDFYLYRWWWTIGTEKHGPTQEFLYGKRARQDITTYSQSINMFLLKYDKLKTKRFDLKFEEWADVEFLCQNLDETVENYSMIKEPIYILNLDKYNKEEKKEV